MSDLESQLASRIREPLAALEWVLKFARGFEWRPDGVGGPNICFECGQYSTQGHREDCRSFKMFTTADAALRALLVKAWAASIEAASVVAHGAGFSSPPVKHHDVFAEQAYAAALAAVARTLDASEPLLPGERLMSPIDNDNDCDP